MIFLLIKRRKFLFLVITIVALFASVSLYNKYNATSETLSRYGSSGSEVRQIQTKLKNWGYYNGNVDGIYGSKTVNAVKYFQRKNGLTADGIAGTKTLAAMGIRGTSSNSSNSSSSSNLNSQANINLLAHLIHGEARGEPYNGMVAVAAVVLNRIDSPNFPSTIPGVIYQKGAFTAVDDGQINLTPNQTSYNAARDALNGWDPTGGALYYFNPNTATNKWIWSRPMTVVIGKHRFCR